MSPEHRQKRFQVHLVQGGRKYSFLTRNAQGKYSALGTTFSCALDKRELKRRISFILALCSDFSTELSLRFCDAAEMQTTNHSFRGKDYPTDVLSFPHGGVALEETSYFYLGDLLICLPVCLWQSKRNRVDINDELERMIIHGIVHLKGFDHERDESAYKVMTGLEKSIKKELVKSLGKPSWFRLV